MRQIARRGVTLDLSGELAPRRAFCLSSQSMLLCTVFGLGFLSC